MLTAQLPIASNSTLKPLPFRHLLARSNHFLIAHLPTTWIYWFAWPHEVWHFLVAGALGLRPRLVPGATLYESTTRWKSILVLLAPATLGLVWPLAWMPLLQWASHYPGPMNWPLLVVSLLGWWGGCLGDFIDAWLLTTCGETQAQHRARMQGMIARYRTEPAYAFQTARD